MLTLIESAEVFAPASLGAQSILLIGDRIGRIGDIDRRALDATGLPFEVVDAAGCVAFPGLIDPHEHLIGGSGESGFASQTPEITSDELASAAITTVVGCLGVDTSTRTMAALVAKVKALRACGFSAFAYTGGYDVPPKTLTASVREDILYVEEILGAGEIAISDRRGSQPSVDALARLVSDAYVGGLLSGKAGVTHFHVGAGSARLLPLRQILERSEVHVESLYPTHVERTEELMREAIALGHLGMTFDMDVVEGDLVKWVRFARAEGADFTRITVSSDASITAPRTLLAQLRAVVTEGALSLADALPLFTSNTARILRLGDRGRLERGLRADIAISRRDDLTLVDLWAGGKRLVNAGATCVRAPGLAAHARRSHVQS